VIDGWAILELPIERPEVIARGELLREFCDRSAPGQHYLVTYEVFHEDDCNWIATPDGRLWSFDLRHPQGCDVHEGMAGDGKFFCPVDYEVSEVGVDAFGDDLIERFGYPPFDDVPIIYVCRTSGYYEPEFEAWIERGLESERKTIEEGLWW
jgi:hypothetical protein